MFDITGSQKITVAVKHVYKIFKLCTYPLTNGLINWIIVVECDVSKASKAFCSTILNEIDVINVSKLGEILRQDWLIGGLLQTTNKDLTNTNLIFTMQRFLYRHTVVVVKPTLYNSPSVPWHTVYSR